ncbi:MAG TPA: hypothetical protein VJ571_04330 [Candidatus Nitrosotalea sp.]|nr:hypothetical protein [Candidatus Nitrosotalea sp.]
MDVRRRIPVYLMIGVAFAFTLYFFVSPFLSSSDQGGTVPALNQSPDSVSTLGNDIDTCVTTPTSDCDQEMLQIKNYCTSNRGQNIPICSDVRVQEYIDSRGLERPVINTGN